MLIVPFDSNQPGDRVMDSGLALRAPRNDDIPSPLIQISAVLRIFSKLIEL
jgi:hypothetical protein